MGCLLGHRRCKRSGDLAAGDVVLFLGTPHLIDRIEPRADDLVTGVARAADGWGISLSPTTCVEVA